MRRTCLCLLLIGVHLLGPGQAQALPNDPLYVEHMQTALERIGMPAAWAWLAHNPPSRPAVVAVIDTGIVHGHPDLDPARILPGYDFVDHDADPTDPGTVDAASSGLHGLHVSGLIAASTGNGKGMASVAGASLLLPVRALGVVRGGGRDQDIADAIRWAAGLLVAGAPRLGTPADVINLSFAAPGSGSFVVQQAINEAIAAGAIVVAEAGDHDPGQDGAPGEAYDALGFSPGGLDQVITVGAAADPLGSGGGSTRAAFSNYGARVDLLAPGANLYSTYRNVGAPEGAGPFTYHALSGTSQAAAQVSGAAALVRSLLPLRQGPMALLLHVSANRAYLCDQARHPGCGAGLLNVAALLELAGQQAECLCPGDQACLGGTCVAAGDLHPSRYGGADVAGGCTATRLAPAPAPTSPAPAALALLLLGVAGRRQRRRRHAGHHPRNPLSGDET